MADDMGYSDLGCYGGEIQTPHLDRLAKNGLRFTQFYNGARCCPTRASLLTGLAPHQTGMGWMTIRNQGHEGYTGNLNQHCVTLAEVLKEAGYATFMSGKWHLSGFDRPQSEFASYAQDEENRESWPIQRGFDEFFGIILGGANFYNPSSLVRDNEHIEAGPTFFFTDEIVSNAISFLGDHSESSTDPFFLYLPFTAPHFPLHARDSVIEKYLDRYEVGWEKIRTKRLERMMDMGLIPPEWDIPSKEEIASYEAETQQLFLASEVNETTELKKENYVNAQWSDLNEAEKKDLIKRMATYAAQIDEMDQQIGRLIKHLEDQKSLDNTVILFLSDNGATAEHIYGDEDRSTEAIGTSASFESYRLPWAEVSNTPFRLFKHWAHEGGISTPLIVHWPEKIQPQDAFVTEPTQLTDIMPTLLEIGRASYPDSFKGQSIHPIEGQSLLPLFTGQSLPERTFYWEHEANRAIRKGKWKLVSKAAYDFPYTQRWELYDIEEDRTEMHDQAANYPEKVTELSALWESWAESHMVYPLDGRDWDSRMENPVDLIPFDREIVVSGLEDPMAFAFLPDGQALVVERKGALKLWTGAETKKLAQFPVMSCHHEKKGQITASAFHGANYARECGFTGLAVSPDFETTGHIFVTYSAVTPSVNRLSRFRFDNGVWDMSSESVILEVPHERSHAACHESGCLAFDSQGLLYWSIGDNTNPFRSNGFSPHNEDHPIENAARSSGNSADLRGGIVRIRPLSDGGYEVPEGNLFQDALSRKEIFVKGCRNPFRISIDPKTDFLYWGDVGPDSKIDRPQRGTKGYDEINQARKAGFYGWPFLVADNKAYDHWDFQNQRSLGVFSDQPENHSKFNTGLKTLPEAQKAWLHYSYDPHPEFGEGPRNSMAGPVIYKEYSQQKLPDFLDQSLLIYDWMRGWIKFVRLDEEHQAANIFTANQWFNKPIDVKQSPTGELYVLEYGTNWSDNTDGKLIKLQYSTQANREEKAKLPAIERLVQSRLCYACHQKTTRSLGPSFQEIADKYQDIPEAIDQLAKKVREGGGGVWGEIPMPPQSQVKEQELNQILQFILKGGQ